MRFPQQELSNIGVLSHESVRRVKREGGCMTNGQFRLIDLIDDMCAGKDIFFQWVRVAEDVMTYHVKTLTRISHSV